MLIYQNSQNDYKSWRPFNLKFSRRSNFEASTTKKELNKKNIDFLKSLGFKVKTSIHKKN